MKFIITGGGDSDVGIGATDSVITIEDNYTWDKDMINQFKEMIKEFYDNGNVQVYTDIEWEEERKFEESIYGDGDGK